MSLSNWLKNYLYIPLGGNRNATFGTFFWIVLFAVIAVILSGSWVVSVVFVGLAAALFVVGHFKPERRKKILANINRFITMLLGGLWHGASWNFIIWGGLNGIGLVVYQFWKEMGWNLRFGLVSGLTALLGVLHWTVGAPVWNLLFVWALFVWAGTLVRYVYQLRGGRGHKHLGYIWGVAQTFTFITFTRLFFRSGSNLDPATANEVAWQTARRMVEQIGSKWDWSLVPDICANYWKVFALVLLGMAIHWLPVRWKRWYRLNFAMLPLPVMAAIVVAVVFVVYQFITADLQAFIYFQF
jgi:D-alanyl-lipoteichoic acid acyltransferase DltB (MBOAT superfamily)